ncbi:hypothetical protein Y032_0016g3102 [Ancylostoma ceylanicum]|uniref:Uncharacterized protein n=1 Tax=Ancylostoma ceylanicum TaxID=53326 RepID=A0A016V8N0_9BILA|nr:hypothetical protein Y032_0016g3102 [Ancylostoma ceylanicum]
MVNARQITWAAMYLYAVSFFILIEVVAADSSSTAVRRSIRSNNKQCVSILVCRIPMRIDTHLLLSDRIGLRHTINKTYNNQQKLLTDT